MDQIQDQRIEIMEKQRCWQTVLNNRLYKDLKDLVKRKKKNLDESEEFEN